MVFGVSVSLQIALASTLLAGDYYATYSLASKQLVMSSERTTISRAIVPLPSSKILFQTEIENTNPTSANESAFIKEHKEQIIQELMGYQVSVVSNQKIFDVNNLSETTDIKFGPIPIKIEFNDVFVTIKVPQE